MTGHRIVLDADAIVMLRASAENPFLSIRRSMPPRSLFQWTGMKQEHEFGTNLRNLLLVKQKQGWQICATKGTWFFADRAFSKVIEQASKTKKNAGIAKYKFLNQSQRNRLFQSTNQCDQIPKEKYRLIKQGVTLAFEKWDSPETRRCIKKGGKRKKRIKPEPEDIDRLTEAIANREISEREILFITGDNHFICHADNIKMEFGIEIHNFRAVNI